MAVDALVGRTVVKSAACIESRGGADGKRRRTVPCPYSAVARRAFSRLGHFSRETQRLARPRDVFFCDYTVRVLPEVLQNNATQKDDTLRAHQARGKSTTYAIHTADEMRPWKRASECHTFGGVVRVQCCHCRGEQLIRSPGRRASRRPPRASS